MNRRIKKNRALAMILTVLITITAPLTAIASDVSRVEVGIAEGTGRMTLNGTALDIEKPFRSNGVLFVPLRSVMEAFGAEVAWEGKSVNVIFGNTSAEITVGKTDFTVNQSEGKLEAAPLESGNTVFVPVSFISDNFDMLLEEEGSSVRLILQDDGALSDLSFLTGGISKEYIGNSYFGWTLLVPKGSRIISETFNSGYVLVENEQREIVIEISAFANTFGTLREYYEEMLESPELYFDGELIDSALTEAGGSPHAEFLMTSSYDEAVYTKAFIKGSYVLRMTLTAYMEADPAKILQNSSLSPVLASFTPSYKDAENVQDISKVKFGLAKYESYVASDTGSKYFVWEMDVLPEWNEFYRNISSPYYTELGIDGKEYVSVEIVKPVAGGTAYSYGSGLKEHYSRNFSSSSYTLRDEEYRDNADNAYRLVYSIRYGKNEYVYDETIIASGGLLFDISFKCPADKYDGKKGVFEKMLGSFRNYTKDYEDLGVELDKFNFSQSRNRVGKDERPTLFENKSYGWSIELPGYWFKNSVQESEIQSFSNYSSGGSVIVEAVEIPRDGQGGKVEDGFRFLSEALDSAGIKLVSTENIKSDGRSITYRSYRIENPETEQYMELKVYILTGGKYAYCFISALPDICASEHNIREMGEIWSSFTLTEPPQ